MSDAVPQPTPAALRLWCTKCQAHYDRNPPKNWCPRCDGERLPANSLPVPDPTPAALAALNYDKLERLAEAATPIPWHATTNAHPAAVRLRTEATTVAAPDCRIYTSRRDYECDRETWERQCADAEFIVALRNAFPALLAAARRGAGDTARLDWLEERVDGTGEALVIGGVCYWSVGVQAGGPRSKITRLGEGDGLREAIDASRAAHPEEPQHG